MTYLDPMLVGIGQSNDPTNVSPVTPLNPMPAAVAAPTVIRHGQAAVGTSAVQLTAGAVTQGVNIKAPSENTGNLYVGITGVTTSNGYPLAPGDSTFVACDNANRIYVISDTAAQAVGWIGS